MLHFQIDPHSGVPVYRQLMDQIRYYISSGALKNGDRVPSIRELSKSLSINPTTVQKAYNELTHMGVIEMARGLGAFVSDHTKKMTQQEKEKVIRRLAMQLALEASQLKMTAERIMKIVHEALGVMEVSTESQIKEKRRK